MRLGRGGGGGGICRGRGGGGTTRERRGGKREGRRRGGSEFWVMVLVCRHGEVVVHARVHACDHASDQDLGSVSGQCARRVDAVRGLRLLVGRGQGERQS